LLILKIEIMTSEEINTLENKVFRLECEQLKWRNFRKVVESFVAMIVLSDLIPNLNGKNLKKN